MKTTLYLLLLSITVLCPLLSIDAAAGPVFSRRRTPLEKDSSFIPKTPPGGPIETNEQRQWAQGNPPSTSTSREDVHARQDFVTDTTPANTKEELIASQQNAIPPRNLRKEVRDQQDPASNTLPSTERDADTSLRDTTPPNTPRGELQAQGVNPNLFTDKSSDISSRE